MQLRDQSLLSRIFRAHHDEVEEAADSCQGYDHRGEQAPVAVQLCHSLFARAVNSAARSLVQLAVHRLRAQLPIGRQWRDSADPGNLGPVVRAPLGRVTLTWLLRSALEVKRPPSQHVASRGLENHEAVAQRDLGKRSFLQR